MPWRVVSGWGEERMGYPVPWRPAQVAAGPHPEPWRSASVVGAIISAVSIKEVAQRMREGELGGGLAACLGAVSPRRSYLAVVTGADDVRIAVARITVSI